MKHSVLLAEDIRWLDAGPLYRHRFPLEVRHWLEEPGSLTARLEVEFGSVRVTVLQEGRGRLLASERRRMDMDSREWIWSREVLLEAGGRFRVAARTVAPFSTLRGAGAAFARLGNRPLGELLFTHPDVVRCSMEWGRLDAWHWRLAGLQPPRWGRRTLYWIGAGPLLVNEFFLPGVLSGEVDDCENG